MGEFHLLYLQILLMRSGDIETNPGPNTSHVSEKELSELSELIAPSYYDKLGINLDILYAQLQAIKERSNSTSEAFLRVFMKWRDRQASNTNIRALLAEKLKESGLAELSGDLLDDSLMTNMSGQPSLTAESQTNQPLSPELIQECAKDFKDTYITSLCQIRADPLNPDSLVQFEDLYTHLKLESEDGEKNRLLEYSDLLKLRYNGRFPRRLSVQGEAGAGKTTFCAKIAWDWINGKYFQEFKWVIIVPLREYEQCSIGEIAKSYLPESNTATVSQLTEYMRLNTDKVFIVFDGLDEFKGNLIRPKEDGSKSTELQSQSSHPSDSPKYQSKQGNNDDRNKNESTSTSHKVIEIVEILRSEKLKECPVMVTTRPWRAKEIRGNDQLRKMYRFLYVEGFSKENLTVYIQKHFAGHEAKANNLIQFVGDNDVISENMAPYPIYVAMLCLMWREFDEKRQEVMKSLQTFSQIFQEMILFLKEHYAQKLVTQSCSIDDSLDDHLDRIDDLLKPIASLAFDGLLSNTLVFTEAEFEHCRLSVQTACRVGVLSQEKKIISRQRRRKGRRQHPLSTAFFPHKLFQELMAGMHFASLYETDNNEYKRLMTEIVIPRKEEFRYLLYFTSSESQAVGIDVLTHLSRTCRSEDDKKFLVDVAFECHDSHAATLIKDIDGTLKIDDYLTAHTIAGYTFVGIDMIRLEVGRECGPTVSHEIAEMICSSPSLKTVDLEISTTLHANFYHILAARGQYSMVQSLSMDSVRVSASSSADLASGLCTLPHLTKLIMRRMPLVHDEFCSTLRALAPSMKVQSLSMDEVEVSPSASADLAAGLCTLPNLTELTMYNMPLHDEFCSTLRALAPSMKVQSLSLKRVEISAPASADLASGVCTLPHLTELTMRSMPLHDEFCSTLRVLAPSGKVQSLYMSAVEVPSSASADLASGLCTLPHLTELTMVDTPLYDEFCSTLRALAPSMKVQSLIMDEVLVSSSASADLALGLCTLRHLNELTMGDMPLHDEFCSTLRALAPSMKVQSLSMDWVEVSASASADLASGVCTLPHLTKLTMDNMSLHDEFCSTLRALAQSMKVQSLSMERVEISAPASADLASGVCTLPNLTELIMKHMPLHDEFCSTLRALAPSMKVQSLIVYNVKVSSSASADLALGLCTLPHLTQLSMKYMPLHDEFCSTLRALAPTMKVQSLSMYNVKVSSSASADLAAGLYTLPHLTELTIDFMSLHDELCSSFRALAQSMKDCFPQISKGNFKFNGESQDSLESFLSSVPCYRDDDLLYSSSNEDDEEDEDESSGEDDDP